MSTIFAQPMSRILLAPTPMPEPIGRECPPRPDEGRWTVPSFMHPRGCVITQSESRIRASVGGSDSRNGSRRRRRLVARQLQRWGPIVIEPDALYESCSVSGPDGALVVSTPGGELAIWSVKNSAGGSGP